VSTAKPYAGRVAKVILYVATSLDGFIAEADGGVSFLEPFQVDGEDHGYAAFMAQVDTLALGARTYEQAVSFGWEYGARPAFVFSRRELPVPPGADVRFVSGAVADVLPQLDGTVFLVGGADLVRQFLEARAIDELNLHVVPVLLGGGIPLFADPPFAEAELTGTEAYSTGVVRLSYRLKGFDGRVPV